MFKKHNSLYRLKKGAECELTIAGAIGAERYDNLAVAFRHVSACGQREDGCGGEEGPPYFAESYVFWGD